MYRAILPVDRAGLIGAVAAALALATCTTTPPGDQIAAGATPASASSTATPDSQLRDLTPAEKKVIVDTIAPNLKNPGSAKYHWTKFPTVPPSNEVAYCATVDAESPHAAFSGKQAYIIDVKVSGGHIASAVLGLIVGGKDNAIVAGMCKEHGLDPFKAS
jgi:hypothetical protein